MTNPSTKKGNDISIVLCGQAGQGIQTVEKIFTRIMKSNGYHVYATKEYMSRVRGGLNSILIRISDKPVKAFVDRIDILVGLNKGSIKHLKNRVTSETLIIGEKEVLSDEIEDKQKVFDIPFTEIASGVGNKVFSNTVAVGALISILSVKPEDAINCLKQIFKDKPKELIDKNIEALKAGYETTVKLENFYSVKIESPASGSVKKQILVNGSEAVGLGAIAGGCNFISSYPMSPSTSVLVFLAQKGKDFGVLAEQAEDEISAINMAIGAWYAGARAMVTTSGGGFALMTEGVSLAGMLESPIVIHLAQRPGPATGLPTRTEQGDLDLVLYAGHGEFPRIIFAPGTLEDAFYLTQKAFNLADKFQVPVFILTDQYFVDSYYNTEPFNLKECKVEKHFIETSEDYQRYKLTENEISPRGIPGLGKGLVCADSDEHDEEGHITEDLELRIKMVDKRLGKLDLIKQESVPPVLLGPENYENLVICWGSTFNIICEAVNYLGRKDTAVLYFNQVYPLHDGAIELIKKAKKTIVVENNAAAQFARLLKIHADVKVDHNVLKYDGLCFASDSIAEELNELL
ncbi:MAG: 2-oxoacid:acceptor oxidoreductase subunit alpha [Sedimentisphaerales bacterium]|nr:2-oxoacid:acceptor oxidoreductase subunit alpha [Sedimentisphaerales bacterium]